MALAEGGHAVDGPLEDGADVVPILREGAEAKIAGDTIEIPHLGPRLGKAHHDLARLLFEVGVAARVTDHRHAALQTFERLCDDVEVLACLERHVYTDRGGEMTGPHAGGQHHRFRLDRTLLGVDPPNAAVGHPQFLDCDALEDPGSTILGTLGECHGDIDR